jgi:RES domain-containing protein
MKLWRISNNSNLLGLGGLRAGGRWHNRGAPIVYLSENPALALLEVMVHLDLDKNDIPNDYQLLEINYNERKGVSRLKESVLEENWRNDEDATREIGDEWLMLGGSLLLRVPSAILPQSYNYLLNPKNSLAVNLKIINISKHPFDKRLLKQK